MQTPSPVAVDSKTETQAFFEEFTEALLRPYINRIKHQRSPGSKELNDPVWQTLVLHALEVVILDSPLLQRLRLIRQLGVAHYVYPGTTHTRLEHSLGALHQIQRLADAINTSGTRVFIDNKTIRLLRLIALCHDIGHGVMSHVSENALRRYEAVEDIELQFADSTKGEKAKLSEIGAYFMVGSPAFRDLLTAAQTLTNDHELPRDAIKNIQQAIIGEKISDEIPLLNELISGPFDADKLDYMTRDAQMAGVPIVTDIPRLVKKVRAVEVGRDDLPIDIAKVVEDRPSYVVTCIALSGGRTLDELMLGRTLLFDKIYRHQKVRAAEAMVAGIIRCLIEATQIHPAILPYRITDDELLFLSITSISQLAGHTLTEEQKGWAETAVDLSHRLRERQIFVRAFAFAQTMPLDPNRHQPAQRQGLERLVRDTRNTTQLGKLLDQVTKELKKVLNLLSVEDLAVQQHFEAYLHLDPPSTAPNGGDITRAYLVTNARKLIRFREDAAETRGWADAYLLTRETGYIFCPQEIAPYVYLSAEKVIRTEYGVQLPEAMLAYAKQDPEDIRKYRETLSRKGYYIDAAYDLRPLPARLRKADIQKSVAEILQRMSGYQGPLLPGESVSKSSIDGARIFNWLRQFETDELINNAIELLLEIRLIGRKEATEALSEFFESNPEFKGAILCPLGSWKDSSAITTYYSYDVAPKYGLESVSLPQALAIHPSRPIVFFDDFIGSGSQSISIIEDWLGVAPTTDLGEERGETLSSEAQQGLKGRPIAFVYSAGMAEGEHKLPQRCHELGLNAKVYVHLSSDRLPRAFANDRFPSLRARCAEIGAQLLKNSSRDPEKLKHRTLGYGNEGLLVIFPYNTPSQTLTCLWKDGEVAGTSWMPLFPRRKKL